ncbi:LysR family transcriptional regulator [Labrys sp. LIt4]|uniref:LysR family transcriptional regulator n=1 Tax=Labrys okinawensis TaxID=346911 RepID=A0A2S9QE10_9HYPH|nr:MULTISPECIES: LysR family transcriptional regulator [Labrys]MBP0579949.1 LysR family transcriptional regulator [Labrys sp. LIt4]PRH87582.1 LysR family transcriptional regulator [Labrys okinawensis]
MARSDPFDGLTEFLAIVRRGSFRAAAIELGVTAGAVSQALQGLERRLGLPLLHRTTRSIALTEDGERLLSQLGPAAETIVGVLDELVQSRLEPSGTLRLLVHRMALVHVLEPVLPQFHRRWPEMRVDVTVDSTHAELVEGGFDAGIRVGEFIDRDMIAVRVTPIFRWVVMAAPAYLARRGRPQVLEDIAGHECLRYRRPDVGDIYRWEFERDGQALSIDPPGAIVANDPGLLRSLAVQGMGLLYGSTLQSAKELEQGLLEPVLEEFSPAGDALFIYFPRTSRSQPKLRAFVEACTEHLRQSAAFQPSA